MENKIEKYTYTRSLCMVLYRAVTLEAPGMTLRVEHSISHGQYCRLLQADGSVRIPEVLRPYMGGKEVLVP